MKMEPTLKIDSSFEAGSRRHTGIGLTVKEIAEYVRQQQALDREERAAWREAQKRQVEIRMAELQVEDKKRADESEDKRRAEEDDQDGSD